MIDFIKAHFEHKGVMESTIINSPQFIVTELYNRNFENTTYPMRTKLHNLQVNITNSGGYISNSLHKYYNQKKGSALQNADDFNYNNLCECLDLLQADLEGYDLSNTRLTKLEFGFNIDLEYSPSKFIQENVLLYKLKSSCYDPKNKPEMCIKKFEYDQYTVKIYDKSLQFGLNGRSKNILRFEICYTSKRQFNDFGIFNLNDLRKRDALKLMFKDLLKKYDELLIIDSYKGTVEMEKSDNQKLIKYTNPSTWIDYTKNASPNTKSRHFKKFKQLITDNDLDDWQHGLRELLIEKFIELMGGQGEIRQMFSPANAA